MTSMKQYLSVLVHCKPVSSATLYSSGHYRGHVTSSPTCLYNFFMILLLYEADILFTAGDKGMVICDLRLYKQLRLVLQKTEMSPDI